ncbi:MAG: hypothetical protein K0R10_809 [Alphaproteobacteria bacterium]|jgi:hypothetical protein|nr:hypothetical protein [Alphaproteobacteria bacterium]
MLTGLEAEVMHLLLQGDNAEKEILRQQFHVATILKRELTVVGFFLNFSVPDDAPKLADRKRQTISGVGAKSPQIPNDSGFVLFISDGVIDFLEGFTYGDPWPDEIEKFDLYKT